MNPVIIIAGYTAAGKTTLARQLAAKLEFSFIDLGSIVRQTTLDFLKATNSANAIHQKLDDETAINAHMRRLVLVPTVNDDDFLDVEINGKKLDINDSGLRESFLDDKTLFLARLIRPSLIHFQRKAAELRPVIFSARNGVAFTEDESVRVFINSGMTTRVRRRARYEGTEYGDLSKEKRRDLINRVVTKEKKSESLTIALRAETIAQKGFVLFRNHGSTEQSLSKLTRLTTRLMAEKDWGYYPGKERFSGSTASMERRGSY